MMTKFELALNTLNAEVVSGMVKEIVATNEDKFTTLLNVLGQDAIATIVSNAILAEEAEMSPASTTPVVADPAVATLEAEIAKLQEKVAAHLETITSQKDELNTQAAAYQAMVEKYEALAVDHTSLQDKLKAVKCSLSTSKGQVTKLQNKVVKLEQEHADALAAKGAELNEVQAKYNALLEELAFLKTSNSVEEDKQEEAEFKSVEQQIKEGIEQDTDEWLDDEDENSWFDDKEEVPTTNYSYRSKEDETPVVEDIKEEAVIVSPEQVEKLVVEELVVEELVSAELVAEEKPAKKLGKLASLKKASINDFNGEAMIARTPKIEVTGSFEVKLETQKYGYGCPLATECQKANKAKHNSQTKIVERPCVEKGCPFICGQIQDNLKEFVSNGGSYAYAYEGKQGRLYVHGKVNNKKVDLGILNFTNTVEGRKIEDIVRASVKQKKSFQINKIICEDKVMAVARGGRAVNEVVAKTPDIFTKVVITF